MATGWTNKGALRLTRDSDCVTRRIAGETVIVPVRAGVGDLDAIYVLNDVGSLIWQLLDGGSAVSQIETAIQDAYDVDPQQVTADVRDFLDALATSGLVRIAEAEGA